MSNMEACSTCATLLSKLPLSTTTEKPRPPRQVECCGRWICANCIHTNPRFGSYCPYCQVSSASSSSSSRAADLHATHQPPPYTPSSAADDAGGLPPPPYEHGHGATQPSTPSVTAPPPSDPEKAALAAADTTTKPSHPGAPSLAPPPAVPLAEDVLHFLDHAQDSITSLSLAYGVPASTLRRANKLSTDELLFARRTIIIPLSSRPEDGTSTSPPPPRATTSLRPRPVEGEEEERRKGRVRRWMLACREPDYDLALLYLDAAGYDVDEAVERYRDDERWERENPLVSNTAVGKGGAGVRRKLVPPRR